MIDGAVTLDVDIHKNPYYGCRDDPYGVEGRLKVGITPFHAQSHAYLVTEGVRLTLAWP